jgi:type IV pilus assembly protein PilM
VDGSIIDTGVVVNAIRKIWEDQGIKTKDVATAVSGTAVIIKKIQLPTMSAEELTESMPWEAEQYIPMDPADVKIAYQILTEAPEAGGNMDVLLTAVKIERINEYVGVITQAGLNPVIMDSAAFCLQNVAEITTPVTDEVTALLNIGHSLTNICVVRGTMPLFWRDINSGGHNFTEALQRELNLSFEDAQKLKHGERIGSVPIEQAGPIINAVSEDVGNEIKRSIDFFKATSGGENVRRMKLMGGAAQTLNLANYLASRFSIPVDVINPFANVQVKTHDPAAVSAFAPNFGVAIGLGIRQVGDA